MRENYRLESVMRAHSGLNFEHSLISAQTKLYTFVDRKFRAACACENK